MADSGSAVSCPLCGAEYLSAPDYASHLAEAHGLVDDDGAETSLSPPESLSSPESAHEQEAAPQVVEPAVEGAPRHAEAGAEAEARGSGLAWRHSLGLVVKTVALLVVLASAVAIVASLAKAGP